MSNRKVRVRFAPSPTGPLHMGGVRTALYNYLFAKKNNGDFILRVEDTDQNRFVPGAEEYILEALNWCGISPDESPVSGGPYGPYRQSERKHLYREYAEKLILNGFAYYAFDTTEELDAMRERMKSAGVSSPQYNAVTRQHMQNSLTLPESEVARRLEAGDPYVVRIKMPRNEDIRVNDIIRGWVVVNSNQLDDKVLFKSDGMPTYHLANIVDDHLMEITHVIRGEEWLPSAPLHVLLYQYLGWEDTMPEFAHLPLLLRPDGNGKLSKRDGDRLGFPVFPLHWQDPATGEISSGYREKGYFPEAFINMLAFLGWNPGNNQEIFSLEELVNAFTLDRVGKSGSKFDPEKTNWFNQHYLREKSDETLAKLLKPLLEEKGIIPSDDVLFKSVNLLKERAHFVVDMLEGMYLFTPNFQYDKQVVEKRWNENAKKIVLDLKAVFSALSETKAEDFERAFKEYLEEKQLKIGVALPLLRLSVTGLGAGPSMFQIAEILGKEEVCSRLDTAINTLP
ncbi:MAG: glutamate--tRNA ligase [Luteibaculaceae bacterium]